MPGTSLERSRILSGLALVVISLIATIYLSVLLPNHLMPILGGRIAFAVVACGLTLLVNILLNFYRVRVCDPGYTSAETEHSSLICASCKFYKPPRCHHCSRCARCVLSHDHHCVWTGTCIGDRNLKYFLLLIMQLVMGVAFSFLSVLAPILRCPPCNPMKCRHLRSLPGCAHFRFPWLAFALLLLLLGGVLFVFMMQYVRQVASDVTSMETWGYGTNPVLDASAARPEAAADEHADAEGAAPRARQRIKRSTRDSYAAVFEAGADAPSVWSRCTPRWRHGWLLMLWLYTGGWSTRSSPGAEAGKVA